MKPVLAAVVALVLTTPAAAAPAVVVYRCTAADGAVTLQNGQRCPKGQREERRVVEVPTSRAAPTSAAAPTPASATLPTQSGTAAPASAAGRAVPRNAPNPSSRASTAADTTPVIEMAPASAPPVFACRTWDDQRYYGDSERPAPRCAPLETVGLDRRSATAAQACELRSDTCEPVVESARCDAWAERLREAEARERFGIGDEAEAARTELGRLRTLLAGTVCAR